MRNLLLKGADVSSPVSRSGKHRALRLGAGLPCLIAGVVVASVAAALWSRLPDRIAVHVDASGHPNDSVSPGLFLAYSVVLFVTLGTGFSHSGYRGSMSLRSVYAGSLATATFLGYLFTAIVITNAAASEAHGIQFPLWHLLVAAGGAAAAAAVSAFVPADAVVEGDAMRRSSLRLGRGEQAVWLRMIGPRWVLAVAILLSISAPAGGIIIDSAILWLLPLGVVVAGMVGARVSVGEWGLSIRPPLLNGPQLNVPLANIVGAEARRVRPGTDLGGWGYRVAAGRRGLALRSGDGLWLDLVGGGQFVVVVDDAATAAALLNDLVARRRSMGD